MDDSTAVTSTPVQDAGEPKADGLTATPPAAQGEQATDPKADTPTVPETYELKMPEGIELDAAAADEFKAIAKELKLSASDAQKVADVGAKMAQRQTEAHAKLVASWTEMTKVDKEVGGDKLPENLAIAKKALDTFGTPELRDVLNMTGLGNHPEVIRAFYKAGKAISEDRFVQGAPKAPETDMAKRLFPSMN